MHAPANPSLWQRTVTALLRIALVLSATALMIGALLLGLVVASGIVLWALLRGRRPGPVNLRWGGMPRTRAGLAGRTQRQGCRGGRRAGARGHGPTLR